MALAKNMVSMRGMMSCIEPVVSMTSTVMDMVMRVAPPKHAAAPTTAYVWRSTTISDPVLMTIARTIRPTIWPPAAPTASDGTNSPVGAPMPYVHVISAYMKTKYMINASIVNRCCSNSSVPFCSYTSPRCNSSLSESARGTKNSCP